MDGIFAMGLIRQQETPTLTDNWFRPLGLEYAVIVETILRNLP